MHLNTSNMIRIYLHVLLLPIIFAYDCEEICNVTLSVMENTPHENLQWNLTNLLSNRTSLYQYLQFSLSNPSKYFEIHSPTLKFRSIEFDREQICENRNVNDECSLQLQIFTQTSFLLIFKLIILDENDWKPFFSQDYISLIIRENLPRNHRVQLPIAYDYDSIQYNIDHYEFLNHNIEEIQRIFQLEQSQDELRLKLLRILDCEMKNNYQLYIIAIDKSGYRSNILHVNITVGDLNEYQPRFTQQLYHANIPENLFNRNTSSSILQISAIDDDCYDQTILYTILNTDIPKDMFPFEINNHSGLIRMKHSLDYETISTYRFRVKAANLDGITSSIVPVIIDISDINDNKPMIQMNILNVYKLEENEDHFSINISENIRLGQVIGNILIRDLDSAMINYHLSLKIVSCLPLTIACPIELDSGMENNTLSSTTYVIKTARQLNREHGDREFIIILEARDYGNPSLSSQRRLMVYVTDENDCAPKFTYSSYQFQLSNSSFIGQVQANDADSLPNHRRIQYKLLEYTHENIVRIDPNNGSLFLVKQPSTDLDHNDNGLVNYYFTNKDHYNYFHIYHNGSVVLYNLFNIRLPIRLEIYARDYGYPKALESKQNIIVYVCDIFAQNECPSNKLRRNFYLGSIIIMVSVVLFLFMIILCIIWNLFIKDYLKNKENNQAYNCRMEARKNLIVSDSLYDESPSIYANHYSKCAAV
ncbi:hypothetical protein I4U23_023848 [Adineta vaga]|nr:hypothetical protein I4U23_023848 [Adineta vaga]